MDRRVLPSRLVQDAIKSYVAVRVDVWNAPDIVERYQVFVTPGYAVLDPSGKLLLQTTGYLSPEEFVAFLRDGEKAVKMRS